MSACEILDLASSGLYIASQRLDDDASKEIRTKVINASKDVLQGTMKVSLIHVYAELLHYVKIFTWLLKMVFKDQNIQLKNIFLKVLLVSDDAEVRKVVSAGHLVTECLSRLSMVHSMQDLLANFKVCWIL